MSGNANTTHPRLLSKYRDEVIAQLMDEYKYNNVMQAPTVKKISVNMGLGEAVGNPNIVKAAVEELSLLAGQRAVATKARKSIAGFKLREGMPIGAMVTLRGARMWEFLDRLISIALPRVRDFKGISGKAFDGRGNYNLGLKEQLIFPEIKYDDVDRVSGLNVAIATSADTDAEAKTLLTKLGMPFRN